MIVIINGPLGIGKTEVSWKLLEHFERAVMLDGDYLGAVVPFEIYNEQRVEYLYQTLSHLVAWHLAHGYQDFVLNYVFEQPESLERLVQLLSASMEEMHVFRLTCDEAAADQRIRKRALATGQGGDLLDWELFRFRELTQIQQSAARRGDLGLVIDTTHLDAQGVADKIWNQVISGLQQPR